MTPDVARHIPTSMLYGNKNTFGVLYDFGGQLILLDLTEVLGEGLHFPVCGQVLK